MINSSFSYHKAKNQTNPYNINEIIQSRFFNKIAKEANQKLESIGNAVLLKELLAGCIVEFEVTLSQFIKVNRIISIN